MSTWFKVDKLTHSILPVEVEHMASHLTLVLRERGGDGKPKLVRVETSMHRHFPTEHDAQCYVLSKLEAKRLRLTEQLAGVVNHIAVIERAMARDRDIPARS